MSEAEALVIFNAVDTNGDGELTPLELSTRLSDFGMNDDQVIYLGNLYLHAMYVVVVADLSTCRSMSCSLFWTPMATELSPKLSFSLDFSNSSGVGCVLLAQR